MAASDIESEVSPPWTVQFFDCIGKQFQIAVSHYEKETICVIIEDYGTGQMTINRYPRNHSTRLRSTRYNLIWAIGPTVGGHVISMSCSGTVHVCWRDESNESINNGTSTAFYPFGVVDDRQPAANRRYPFICVFSGVMGNVTSTGTFYLWRVT